MCYRSCSNTTDCPCALLTPSTRLSQLLLYTVALSYTTHALQPHYPGLLLVVHVCHAPPHLRAFAHTVYSAWTALPCPLLNSLFRSQIKPHFENKFSGSKSLFHASMKSCISTPQYLTRVSMFSL